jgi:hypothetical protein
MSSYKVKLIFSEHLQAFKDEYKIPDDYRNTVTILILKRGEPILTIIETLIC